MTIIFLGVAMVPAIFAGLVASVLFEVANHYGLFGRAHDGTPLRVRKIYLSIVPISFVAAYIALAIAMSVPRLDDLILLVGSGVLTVLIVTGLKFIFLCCAIRRDRRAAHAPIGNETREPMDAAPIAPAPHT